MQVSEDAGVGEAELVVEYHQLTGRDADDAAGVILWSAERRLCRTGSSALAFCAGDDACAAE
jgi:hypothetical protein